MSSGGGVQRFRSGQVQDHRGGRRARPSLASGEIDILVWVNTWTTSRDATWWGGNFVHTTLYDGQGFAVPAALGITSATHRTASP